MKLWASSERRLYDPRIDDRLKQLFDAVVSDWPFPLWELQINRDGGYRTAERQKDIFDTGASKTLQSKHMKGKAIDITLYWAGTEKAIWDRYSYAMVAGYIRFIADSLGIPVIWGADWNDNYIIKEEENWEIDFVHWELKEWNNN